MEGFLGEIRLWPSRGITPRSWMRCEGQLLPIVGNQSLHTLLGEMYGGDGKLTFALPDFRGRMVLSAGQGVGLSNRVLADRGGEDATTLTAANLARHNHPVKAYNFNAVTSPLPCLNDSGVPNPAKEIYPALSPANNFNTSTDGVATTGNIAVGGLIADNITFDNTGQGKPMPRRSPYLTLYYIICIQGAFPIRN